MAEPKKRFRFVQGTKIQTEKMGIATILKIDKRRSKPYYLFWGDAAGWYTTEALEELTSTLGTIISN